MAVEPGSYLKKDLVVRAKIVVRRFSQGDGA